MGDYLSHPGHGGCTVREVCHRDYGGEKTLYFVLIPMCDPNTTIMVPVDKMQEVGIRDIISLKEADHIMEFLQNEEVTWNSDAKQRKQAYEAAAKSSDLFLLARIVKEMLVQETKENLGNFEKEILPRVQKKLFSEMALAKGQSFEEMMHMACHAIQS